MTAALHRRVRQARFRAQTRRWEYRQRHHAKGTWYRLRRLLADAEMAHVLGENDAARLIAEGIEPEAVGFQLEPPKQIFFVSRERAARLDGAPIQVSLDETLLGATRLALTRFDTSTS